MSLLGSARTATGGCLLALVVGACGPQASETPSSAPIPTAVTGGTTVCGLVPAEAVTLAVGTSKWTTRDLPPLTKGASDNQACFVSAATGSEQRLLDIEKETRADAATVIGPEIRLHIEQGDAALPSDLPGTGYLDQSPDGAVQARLLVGTMQIQVTLLEPVDSRDGKDDVVALTRLLVPRMA